MFGFFLFSDARLSSGSTIRRDLDKFLSFNTHGRNQTEAVVHLTDAKVVSARDAHQTMEPLKEPDTQSKRPCLQEIQVSARGIAFDFVCLLTLCLCVLTFVVLFDLIEFCNSGHSGHSGC